MPGIHAEQPLFVIDVSCDGNLHTEELRPARIQFHSHCDGDSQRRYLRNIYKWIPSLLEGYREQQRFGLLDVQGRLSDSFFSTGVCFQPCELHIVLCNQDSVSVSFLGSQLLVDSADFVSAPFPLLPEIASAMVF